VCNPITGQRRNQYLYEIDLDPAQDARVINVDVPERVVRKTFSVAIDATLPGSFSRRDSTFRLFDEHSAAPIAMQLGTVTAPAMYVGSR
jgi:hypothetical protein